MNSEESRLRTFGGWPDNAPVDPKRIAKAGFYWMGQGLEVQCFSCGSRISEWNYADKVMARHKALDPRCPFVLNPRQSGNIPLSCVRPVASGSSLPLPPLRSPNPNATDSASIRRSLVPNAYHDEAVRLASFDDWPIPDVVSPAKLASAGFYFTNIQSKVICAYCDGVIVHWKPGDDPELVHQKCHPACDFINDRLKYRIHPYSNIQVRDPIKITESSELDALKSLGIYYHRIPRNPKYATVEARLRTYKEWLQSHAQSPDALAEAGFYYTEDEEEMEQDSPQGARGPTVSGAPNSSPRAQSSLSEDLTPRVMGSDIPPPAPHNEASFELYMQWLLGQGCTLREARNGASTAMLARQATSSVKQGGSCLPLNAGTSVPSQPLPTVSESKGREEQDGLEDTQEKPPESEVKPRIPKMCGSQRKRYLHHRRCGLNNEEAYEASKNRNSEEDLAGNKTKQCPSVGKTQKKSNLKRPVRPRTRSPDPQPIKVGIAHQDFPKTLLTRPQIDRIEEGILSTVLTAKDAGYCPAFQGKVRRAGWLMLRCKNERTVEWLHTFIPVLIDVPLRILENNDLPGRHIAFGYFPDSVADSEEDILRLLGNQNKELDTRHWHVMQRLERNGYTQLTVTVDDASATLLESGNRVFYRFGIISLRLKHKEKVKNQALGTMEVDTNYPAPILQEPRRHELPRRSESDTDTDIPRKRGTIHRAYRGEGPSRTVILPTAPRRSANYRTEPEIVDWWEATGTFQSVTRTGDHSRPSISVFRQGRLLDVQGRYDSRYDDPNDCSPPRRRGQYGLSSYCGTRSGRSRQ